MRKTFALLLSILLALSMMPALAEDAFNVGTLTSMNGMFATDLWGSNAADLDVRLLLHGYELAGWKSDETTFAINKTAVAKLEKNGSVYTIQLNNDLKYSDGTAITAKDYAVGLLLEGPQMAELGGNPAGREQIEGMQAYRTGAAKEISGVRIVDDYTLQITISAAYATDFHELSQLMLYPYPLHVIAPDCEIVDDGNGVYVKENVEGAFSAETLKKTLLDAETGYVYHPSVVSGPYVLKSYDAATMKAELEINPYFKGNAKGQKPEIKQITYQTVSQEEAVEGIKNGTLDLLNRATIKTTIDALMGDKSVKHVSYPRSGLSFISFNCERTTVAETAVRQAIAMCFDKASAVNALVGKYGREAKGFYGEGQWMALMANGKLVENTPADLNLKGLRSYKLDTNAASALLEANGWKLNDAGVRAKTIGGETVTLELTLEYPDGSAAGKCLENTLAKNLEEAGIRLNLVAVEPRKLMREYYRQESRNCDMIYIATNFDIAYDPSKYFSLREEDQGLNNRTGIADAELYGLAVAMRTTKPGDKVGYCRAWIAMQERIMEVLPIIPVYTNDYYDFYTPALKGYDPSRTQTWSEAIIAARM